MLSDDARDNSKVKPRKGAFTTPQAKKIVPYYKKYKLNLKELRFVAEYITNGFSGTQACIDAGYKADTRGRASIMSGHIFERPHIVQAIQHHVDQYLAEKKAKLNEMIIDVLYVQAFYDPAMFIKPDGEPKFTSWDEIDPKYRCCVEGITTKAYGKDADRTVTEIKLVPRDKALERLAKFLTLFKGVEDGISLTLSKETEDRLANIFAGRKSAIKSES